MSPIAIIILWAITASICLIGVPLIMDACINTALRNISLEEWYEKQGGKRNGR